MVSSSLVIDAAVDPGAGGGGAAGDGPGPVVVPESLLEVLQAVADPRRAQGRRFSVATILSVALAATLAGSRSFTAIGEWAADAPRPLLVLLGITGKPPSEKTIRRLLQRLDADALDAAIGAWMWLRTKTIGGYTVISFDGKTLRGARGATGRLVHLLAGICQVTGVIVAQIGVDGKTSETPMLRDLLRGLTISGCVITADAAHTCRETARLIIDSGAHYVLSVKGNQQNLRKRCKELPWRDIPILDRFIQENQSPQIGDPEPCRPPRSTPGSGSPARCRWCGSNRTRTVL